MTTSLLQSGEPSSPRDPLGTELNRFISILEEMVVVHQGLIPILQQEKFLVLEGDPRTLLGCVKRKEALLLRLDALEEGRREHLARIRRYLQGDEGPWTIRQLMEHLGEFDRTRIESCRDTLSALTGTTFELNEINHVLIERSLEKTANFLNLLSRISHTSSTYLENGELGQISAQGKMIHKG